MFGDGIKCKCRLYWWFIIDVNDLFPHSLFYAYKGLVDNIYLKEYTILKHGLFVQDFVVFIYANEKMVLELF